MVEKQKMYGLRVIRSAFPEADHVVWVSVFENKLEAHQKFIQEVVDQNDGLTQFERVTTPVIISDYGWFKIRDNLLVYIDKVDDRECVGSMFKVNVQGRIAKTPCGRSSWYVNGESNNWACKLPIVGEYK